MLAAKDPAELVNDEAPLDGAWHRTSAPRLRTTSFSAAQQSWWLSAREDRRSSRVVGEAEQESSSLDPVDARKSIRPVVLEQFDLTARSGVAGRTEAKGSVAGLPGARLLGCRRGAVRAGAFSFGT